MTKFQVNSLGQRGDGIVSTAQGPRHVPKVLPGEVIALGDDGSVELITASPERVAPFCPHHARCGGCKFQHWQEPAYRAWKQAQVQQVLNHAGVTCTVSPLVDAHGEGRRRVSLHVRQINGQWQAGFMEQGSHDLCPITACPVLVPALHKAPLLAAAFGPSLAACDVAITLSATGQDVAIKAERKAASRSNALLAVFRDWDLSRLTVNGEIIVQREQPFVRCGRAQVPLPPQSFLQATVAGEEAIAALVLASLPKAKHVADLFSGLGTFAFRLAERARVTAIDSDKPAIEALRHAARNTQGLKPMAAETRNLFNAPLTPGELKAFDAVVLDPPRAGAAAQVKNLAASAVRNVVYVSCDVQSFARDAQALLAGGYVLEQVTPIDQFKWTAHVELVGHFRKG